MKITNIPHSLDLTKILFSSKHQPNHKRLLFFKQTSMAHLCRLTNPKFLKEKEKNCLGSKSYSHFLNEITKAP